MIVNELGDETRIERMLTEGRLTAEEAERLRDALASHEKREAPLRAGGVRHERRRTWLLIGSLMLLLLLGTATHRWLGDTVGVTSNEAATPAVLTGRLIDLSGLSEERSITMKRSLPISFAVVSGAALVVLGGFLVFFYNGLVGAREQVNSGWAQVENVYQRRMDLVPLLVDAVQTYTEHERETLTELTQARANALQAIGAIDKVPQTVAQLKAVDAAQGKVGSALSHLFAVVEGYPDLKASSNFLALQDQIEGTENRVTMERRNYNEFSRRYNTKLQTFPGNIVAGMMGFEAKPYFEAEREALTGLGDLFGRRRVD